VFESTQLDLKRSARLDVNWSFLRGEDDNSSLTSDADILDPALESNRSDAGVAISTAHVRRVRQKAL